MKRAALWRIGLIVVASCASQPPADLDAEAPEDANASEAQSVCDGPSFQCCAYCADDVLGPGPICVNGVKQCPAGYVSSIQCRAQDPCEMPCSLPSFTRCNSCDGGLTTTAATCNVDAAVYECAPGSYLDGADASAACASDAGDD